MELGVAGRTGRLARLLAEVAVRVEAGSTGGSGFLVAPGMVVTCAHVVGGSPGKVVEVAWQETTWEAEVVACRPERAETAGRRYPHPDLALLKTTGSGATDHGCALLDAALPEPGDELLVLGHTTSWDAADALAESETFRWTGQLATSDADGDGDGVMKLGGGQAVAGMSGGPVLNLRTGRVCGVLRSSRDPTSNLGGWATSSRTVLDAFPELAELHHRYHRRETTWRSVADDWAAATAAVLTRPREVPDDPPPPPSFLLRSEYEVVPFSGRADDLRQLVDWCDGPTPLAVALVTAPGGQGKTRLAQELCRRMADRGWIAGFVRPGASADDVARLAKVGDGCLLCVDYAETLADQVAALSHVLAEAGTGRRRLVLLARSQGDWWARLRESADDTVAVHLFDALTHHLGPVEPPADRRHGFEQARDAFAARLGVDPGRVPPPPNLDEPAFGLTLTLHMAALAMLLEVADDHDPRPASQDPAGRVLDHERRYWRRSAAEMGLPDPDDEVLGSVVAAATLWGAPREQDATRLLAAIPELADQPRRVVRRYARWAAELHPGPAALNPLEPDRLGEDHVAEVVHRMPELVGVLSGVVDDDRLGRALAVLARAAPRHAHLPGVLDELLRADPDRFLVPALQVATQVREPRPLAEAIEAALPSLTDPYQALRLYELLPDKTVALAGVAIQLSRAMVAFSHAVGIDAPERAVAMNGLATRLGGGGDVDEALAVAQATVALLRPVQHEARYRDVLASALVTMGNQLQLLGRRTEAVDAYREAVALQEEPGAKPEGLAGALASLAAVTADPEVAAEHSDRAVAIFRTLLAADESPELRTKFALVLTTHTRATAAAGRYEDAVAAATGAVEVLRPLAELRPDAYADDLGLALGNLASTRATLGQVDEALAPATEAIGIFRRLAAAQPEAYLPGLQITLSNYAGILMHRGDPRAAFDVLAEVVAVYRVLVAQRPDAHVAELAHKVGNLTATATRADATQDGLAVLDDVERQLRELVTEPHGPRRDALAAVLTSRSTLLRRLGRYHDAVAMAGEAVAALQAGGLRQPATLALAQASLALAQGYDGQLDTCTKPAHDAIEICRSHRAVRESIHETVGGLVAELAVPLVRGRRFAAAEACARLAVEHLDALTRRNPAHELVLAQALHNHAVTLALLFGSDGPWRPPIERAIEIRQRWAATSPKAREDLVTSRQFMADVQRRRGRPPVPEPAARGPKVGRNARCPCGSGLKYKQCCGTS